MSKRTTDTVSEPGLPDGRPSALADPRPWASAEASPGIWEGVRQIGAGAAELWRKIRSWRRIRFTTGGLVFSLGALAVGFAAMNTGNNLLFLLLGAMLGTIGLSGWLSERSIRGLHLRRILPRGSPVRKPVRISYEVTNRKRLFPTFALEVGEPELGTEAFVMRVAAGETATVRARYRPERRGVYPLERLTLSTSFPFGLFRKARDLDLPGELVVWPRTDRFVPVPHLVGDRTRMRGRTSGIRTGGRGEFASLRSYRPGDSPRDVHWRSTARAGELMVREYERDGTASGWICLDAGSEPGQRAEDVLEVAASLAARWNRDGRRFGLATSDGRVDAGTGATHLERILDTLARVDFRTGAPPPRPPVDRERCVLVSVSGRQATGYGDALGPGEGKGSDESGDAQSPGEVEVR